MNCPSCNAENSEGARFCFQCGSAMSSPAGALGPEQLGRVDDLVSPSTFRGELVPRDLGGLLAESFSIYRESFWLYWWIVLLASIPVLMGDVVQSEALSAALYLVNALTSLLAIGAVIYAVSQRYLDRRPTVRECYIAALNKGITLLVAFLVFLVLVIGAVLLSIILIGIPLLLYLAAALFFFAEAIVIEGAGSVASLGRSRALVRGTWWRVFGIGIVYVLLALAGGIAVGVVGGIVALANETIGNLVITIGTVFIIPVVYIGEVLVYFDLRVRKEGYSIARLDAELRTQ